MPAGRPTVRPGRQMYVQAGRYRQRNCACQQAGPLSGQVDRCMYRQAGRGKGTVHASRQAHCQASRQTVEQAYRKKYVHILRQTVTYIDIVGTST